MSATAARPAGLRGIVGHAGVVRLLARLVERERLPHAIVLEGPAGCGRRTLARALASALLCPEARGGDSCGICAHCRQSAAGTHPDLTELPSTRELPGALPVDDLRAVAEAAATSPLLGVGKAIILPDAERLRGAAANALLKVLEEPPPRTTLILTATAAAALLGTIRSRVQVYRLQALTAAEAARARGGAPTVGTWPAPPLGELERVAGGLDLEAVAAVLAALPTRAGGDEGEESEDGPRTPAAVQRACLRAWLQALSERQRAALRSSDPRAAGQAADRLTRIARAVADLELNLPPRQALEALALGR